MRKFYNDLKRGKKAEAIVKDIFEKMKLEVEDISNDYEEYGKKGDLIISNGRGSKIYLDVKDDLIISKTHNVFVEESIYRWSTGTYSEGWRYAEYDFLGVLSRPEEKLYIINFKRLKKKIEKNEDCTYKEINNQAENATITGYTIPLKKLEEDGILIQTIKYADDKIVLE